MIFAAPDRFPEVRVAAEASADRIGAAGIEFQHLRGDERLMLPVADADQLQAAGTERELIIRVDVGIIAVELLERA